MGKIGAALGATSEPGKSERPRSLGKYTETDLVRLVGDFNKHEEVVMRNRNMFTAATFRVLKTS